MSGILNATSVEEIPGPSEHRLSTATITSLPQVRGGLGKTLYWTMVARIPEAGSPWNEKAGTGTSQVRASAALPGSAQID